MRNTIPKISSNIVDHLSDAARMTKSVENFYKPQYKENYRSFVKIFLKIKFEKLENDHLGQKISQNIIWNEVIKQKIGSDKWKEFILKELKEYKKYKDLLQKKGR